MLYTYTFTAKCLGKSEYMKDKMGGECGSMGRRQVHAGIICWRNLKEGDHLANISKNGSNIKLRLDIYNLVNMVMHIQDL
jgi:hypothetical protein